MNYLRLGISINQKALFKRAFLGGIDTLRST